MTDAEKLTDDPLTAACIQAVDELRALGDDIGYALLDRASVFDRAFALIELTRVVKALRANKALRKRETATKTTKRKS